MHVQNKTKHTGYSCVHWDKVGTSFFFDISSSITTPQVERNCDWNAGGNYIPSANYRVQVEGHFVTDGVCVCGCNYTCTIQLFTKKHM